MIGREHYFFDNLGDMDDGEIISGFIKQYYMDNLNIPNKIMVSRELEDEKALGEWLGSKTTHKVTIHSPKKGTKLRFVDVADKNSKVTLENKEKTIESILVELKDKFKWVNYQEKLKLMIFQIFLVNLWLQLCVLWKMEQ